MNWTRPYIIFGKNNTAISHFSVLRKHKTSQHAVRNSQHQRWGGCFLSDAFCFVAHFSALPIDYFFSPKEIRPIKDAQNMLIPPAAGF